jgi:hypothetical protein
MTLFWHPTGPKLVYDDGVFYISDLNPQMEHKWRMNRSEMLGLGWRCIKAALHRGSK